MVANQLFNIAPTLLPPTITAPIFRKATESSAIQQLARRVPLAVNAQTAIPVPMDIPEADWVAEGGVKPVGGAATGVKVMTGKKVALLLPVSQEVAMTNAAGLYDQLQQDLPTALARAFDFAAIHGLNRKTGAAGPFADYLLQTPNSVELGTTAQASGGMYADLVKGEQLVTNFNYDFSGFAADPRLRPTLKLQTDVQGRPLWVDNDPTSGFSGGQLIGYPAAYNRGVSGNYRYSGDKVQTVTINGSPTGGTFTLSLGGYTTAPIAYNATAATIQSAIQALGTGTGNPFGGSPAAGATVTGTGPFTVTFATTGAAGPLTATSSLTGGTNPSVTVAQAGAGTNLDSKLRAIGGDFSQCAYGVGMDIAIRVSNEASYVDDSGVTHSAFQENLVLLLCEAYYGFVMGDRNAFVAYTDNV